MKPQPLSLWMMEPERLRRAYLRAVLPPCPTGRDLATLRRQRLDFARSASSRVTGEPQRPKVGVIPVHGPIQQRLTAELVKNDGTSTEEISAYLDAFLSDPTITSIVLSIDSGGGEIGGVEELAAKLFEARRTKKIVAIADSFAASAALWIGAAAEKLYASPGALVGSVGVYMMHVDESKMLEEDGVKVSFVHAARHKVEGNPFEPLSKEAAAHWQQLVDYTYGRFAKALALFRGVTEGDVIGKAFGEGRVLHPEQAQRARMIDGIKSFDNLIGELTMATPTATTKPPARTIAVSGPTPEVQRLRNDLSKHGRHVAAAAEEDMGPKEGDKVTFKEGSEHEPFEAGVEYLVKQISTPALGLATVDDPERIMRWATASELEVAGAAAPEADPAAEPAAVPAA